MTAVEYLIELLAKEKIALPDYIIKNAKQMEKQQIVDAVDYGKNHSYEYSYENEVDYYSSENYYNEKFKK